MEKRKRCATIFPPTGASGGEEARSRRSSHSPRVTYMASVRWWNTFEKSGLPSVDKKERGREERRRKRIFHPSFLQPRPLNSKKRRYGRSSSVSLIKHIIGIGRLKLRRRAANRFFGDGNLSGGRVKWQTKRRIDKTRGGGNEIGIHTGCLDSFETKSK